MSSIYFRNARILRDMNKRVQSAEHEVTRQALRYIVRNTALPQRARAQAQLQLNKMPAATRLTQVKNRCVDSGRGRGVLRDFRLCRYQFRLQALAGDLPGVKKASW